MNYSEADSLDGSMRLKKKTDCRVRENKTGEIDKTQIYHLCHKILLSMPTKEPRTKTFLVSEQ